MSKERKRRFTDCSLGTALPELCYPRNKHKWRRIKPCEETPDDCILVKNLRSPNGGKLPTPADPDAVAVENEEITVECDGGTVGSAVTVAAGEFIEYVDDPKQTNIDAAQSSVNATALNAALSRLNCRWENVEVTENCGGDSIGSSVTISAGSFRSDVSQEDADTQARNAAQAQLDCYWENHEVTLYCSHDADNVPAVEESGRNPIVISSGTYRSRISQADADTIANAAAQERLDCYWENQTVSRSCSPDAQLNGANPVVIEAGSVTSAVSRSDANSIAAAQADSALFCIYANDRIVGTCPGDASSKSIIAVAEASTFMSTVSKADANAQAQAFVDSATTCIWDNDYIAPNPCPATNPQSGASLIPGFGDSLNGAAIPAGSYTSFTSKAEANTIAETIQTAGKQCVYDDMVGGGGTGAPSSNRNSCGHTPFEICASIVGDPCSSPNIVITVNGGSLYYYNAGSNGISNVSAGNTGAAFPASNAPFNVYLKVGLDLTSTPYSPNSATIEIVNISTSGTANGKTEYPQVSSSGHWYFLLGSVQADITEFEDTNTNDTIVCYTVSVSQVESDHIRISSLSSIDADAANSGLINGGLMKVTVGINGKPYEMQIHEPVSIVKL